MRASQLSRGETLAARQTTQQQSELPHLQISTFIANHFLIFFLIYYLGFYKKNIRKWLGIKMETGNLFTQVLLFINTFCTWNYHTQQKRKKNRQRYPEPGSGGSWIKQRGEPII